MENTPQSEIKPCPFCGSDVKIEKMNWDDCYDYYDIYCDNCGGTTGIKRAHTEKEAVNRWNQRKRGKK